MLDYPKVSIVILNWNGYHDTVECLESLRKIKYPNYNVIVVDNGSNGNDAELLKEKYSSYIDLLNNKINKGYANGVNIGILYAREHYSPEFFLLLNNDTIVANDFINQMVKVACDEQIIGMVGPMVYFYGSLNKIESVGGILDMWTGQAQLNNHGQTDTGQFSNMKIADWFGSCLLLKSSVIKTVGLWDEDYFVYWEDVDYGIRVKKAGYKIVCAQDAKIWHKGAASVSLRQSGFGEYFMMRNQVRFMRKHASRCQYFSFLIYYSTCRIWLWGLSLMFRGRMKQSLGLIRGAIDGLFDKRIGESQYK